MNKSKSLLNNGIMFISQRLSDVHSVTISVNFKVGALYESSENNGITHLIEHLYFRQWDDLNQKQLYFEMQCMGAEIIGKTFYDYVCFSITVVPKYFIRALTLIIKCFSNFFWTEDMISIEKNLVCKQIENDYQTYNKWVDNHYFKNTKYEKPIMGTVDSVQTISVDEIRLWKRKYFCSSNSCVVITGNYTKEDFVIANNMLNAIKCAGELTKPVICFPQSFSKRDFTNRYSIVFDDSEFSEITIFFDISDKYDYEIVRLLSSIIGEGCGSVLSMALRETFNFTDDVYTDLHSYCGFNRLSISYSIRTAVFFDSFICLFNTISKFKKNVTQSEYLTSINFFSDNQIMDLDNPKVLNDRYALCDFALNYILSAPIELKEKYEQISLVDLQEYANKIFISDNISFLIQTNIATDKIRNFLEEIIKEVL